MEIPMINDVPPEAPKTMTDLRSRIQWETEQIQQQIEQIRLQANHEIGRLTGVKQANEQMLARLDALPIDA